MSNHYRYSIEEENWLNRQLASLEQVYASVSLGEDHLREFIMWSFDVPVSKSFAETAFCGFNERFRKVMKMHSEFQNLPDNIQEQIWEQNNFVGAAILVSKIECCTSGADQFRAAYGLADSEFLKKEFSHFSVDKLKPLLFSSMHFHSNEFPKSTVLEIRRLAKNISSLISNEEQCKILVLLAIFSDVSSELSSELPNLHNHYLKVISRKMNSNINLESEKDELAVGKMVYGQLGVCLRDLRLLAKLLKSIAVPNT